MLLCTMLFSVQCSFCQCFSVRCSFPYNALLCQCFSVHALFRTKLFLYDALFRQCILISPKAFLTFLFPYDSSFYDALFRAMLFCVRCSFPYNAVSVRCSFSCSALSVHALFRTMLFLHDALFRAMLFFPSNARLRSCLSKVLRAFIPSMCSCFAKQSSFVFVFGPMLKCALPNQRAFVPLCTRSSFAGTMLFVCQTVFFILHCSFLMECLRSPACVLQWFVILFRHDAECL
jgi:hypothetical protein